MYGNYNPYYAQPSVERINNQIAELEKMKSQIQQNQVQQTQPAINQTFQLAPNSQNVMKYVNSIEDVNKELVFSDTPFFSKDLKILWLKNTKGEIKSYELNEIIQKDEKDLLIDSLMLQIEDLKKERNENAKSTNSNDVKPIKNEKPDNSKSNTKPNEQQK